MNKSNQVSPSPGIGTLAIARGRYTKNNEIITLFYYKTSQLHSTILLQFYWAKGQIYLYHFTKFDYFYQVQVFSLVHCVILSFWRQHSYIIVVKTICEYKVISVRFSKQHNTFAFGKYSRSFLKTSLLAMSLRTENRNWKMNLFWIIIKVAAQSTLLIFPSKRWDWDACQSWTQNWTKNSGTVSWARLCIFENTKLCETTLK